MILTKKNNENKQKLLTAPTTATLLLMGSSHRGHVASVCRLGVECGECETLFFFPLQVISSTHTTNGKSPANTQTLKVTYTQTHTKYKHHSRNYKKKYSQLFDGQFEDNMNQSSRSKFSCARRNPLNLPIFIYGNTPPHYQREIEKSFLG